MCWATSSALEIGHHQKRWGSDKCRVSIGNKRALYRSTRGHFAELGLGVHRLPRKPGFHRIATH